MLPVHFSELLVVLFRCLFDFLPGLLSVVLAVILVLLFLLLISAVPRLVVTGIFIRILSVLIRLLYPLIVTLPLTLLGRPMIDLSRDVVSGREVCHLNRIHLFEEAISRALKKLVHF